MVSIIPLAAFSDNYVWAIRAGDRVVVVDPGDDEPVAGVEPGMEHPDGPSFEDADRTFGLVLAEAHEEENVVGLEATHFEGPAGDG